MCWRREYWASLNPSGKAGKSVRLKWSLAWLEQTCVLIGLSYRVSGMQRQAFFINRQLKASDDFLDKAVIRNKGSRIILYFKSNRIWWVRKNEGIKDDNIVQVCSSIC